MSRYHKCLKADIGNFCGFRVSIWLSGCRRHCKNCFNPHTWDFNSGKPFDEEVLKKIETELKKNWCRGTSVLGGEPLEPENLQAVKDISSLSTSLGKDCVVWTGYYIEQLDKAQLDALDNVEWIIDGPFEDDKKDLSLAWRRFKQSAHLLACTIGILLRYDFRVRQKKVKIVYIFMPR